MVDFVAGIGDEQHQDRVGMSLTFRVTARLVRKPDVVLAAKSERKTVARVEREPICRSCEWIGTGDRCIHPAGGCWRSPARREPWRTRVACPMGAW